MKLAVWFCVSAMFFYALETSITDWKLSGVTPRLLTLCYALGVAACAGLALLYDRRVVSPQGGQWGYVALMAAASFVAALSHFAALNQGAGAVRLTMFYCLMPVASSAFMALFRQELPTWRMAYAWLVASAALYLVCTEPAAPGE